MKQVLRYIISVAILALAVVPVASAAEYQGVGGTPANPVEGNLRTQSIFIYQLDPSQTKNDAIKVFNNTDSKRTITLDAVDSVLSSGGAFACAQSADHKADVGAWVTLSKTQVVLEAGGSETVPFTITVPANVSVGEHDGCVTIQDQNATKATGQSGVTLGFRSGIRMAISIPGDIVKKLTVDSLKVGSLKDDKYSVVPTVTNEGNVSLDTDIHARLESIFGTQVGDGILSTYPVLQHSSANWNLELQRPFWGGWYRAYVSVAYNGNPTAGIGSEQGPSVTKELRSQLFFAPPTVLATIIELVLAAGVIAAIVWYVRWRRNIRHIRAHWVDYTAKGDDTIVGIAKERHTSWRKLARANRVKPPYTLKEGRKLKVPPQPKD